MNGNKINNMGVCFCNECKGLDYANDRCPRCGSKNITKADNEFLIFQNIIGIKNKCYIGNLIKI